MPSASLSPPAPLSVVRALAPADATAVRGLVDQATAARSSSPVDQDRLQLALTGQARNMLAALAWDDTHASLRGYVQAVRSRGVWDLDLVVAPGDAGRLAHETRSDLAVRLLRAVLDGLTAENDTAVRLWAFQATEQDDRVAARAGLRRVRELRQMRRPLPLETRHQLPWPLATRAFVVGQDEAAWLEVNNRAFAWHPEQGNLTRADLQAKETAPWFDPAGFLLHEVEGRLAGFCWTKIHRDAEPPVGEIFVIAVDPAFHGRGLGRALVLAGLDHLVRSELDTAMLYVEADNRPALRLYENLGFEVHHVDRVYT